VVEKHAPTEPPRRRGRLRGEGLRSLLIEAGAALPAVLDPTSVLNVAVQLAVPRLGDLALVDLLGPRGLESGAIAGLCPRVTGGLERVRDRSPVDPASSHPVALAVRENRSVWVRDLPAYGLERIAQSEEHLAYIREQAYSAAVVVPLHGPSGKVVGAFSVLRFAGRLPFGPLEKELAEELAKRTEVAYGNALLYDQARSRLSLLESAFDLLECGVTVIDSRGVRVYANPAAAKLLGKEGAEELCGRVPSWLSGAGTGRKEDRDGGEPFPPLAVLAGRAQRLAGRVRCPRGDLYVQARALERAEGRFVLCELVPVGGAAGAI